MDDKKRLIVLLSLLGASLIGGGIWFFMTMSGDEIDISETTSQVVTNSSRIDSLRKLIDKNTRYLNDEESLINSIDKSEKFIKLEDNFVEVEMYGVGNTQPFAPIQFSTSTEDEESGE